MAEYRIEIYNKSGVMLGDIRHLARNLKWSEVRNGAETLSFSMDLAKYEKYLNKLGMNSYDFMDAGTTDIRVVRNGKDRIGAHVIKMDFQPDDPSISVDISCSGYLNYFNNAFIDINMLNQPQGDIMWRAIELYQAKSGANFGIIRGDKSESKILRDRVRKGANVKDFLVKMTNVIDGADFKFTPDKKFNSYKALGSFRPDIRLVYPENVASFGVERSIDSLANAIIGVGAGNGDDAIKYNAENTLSIVERYRREKVVSFNSVSRMETLKENTEGVLGVLKDVRELPEIELADGVIDLDYVGVGDTVYVGIEGYRTLSHIKGYHRIEKIEVSVDENDSERVKLTFDGLNVDDVIKEQDNE